MGEYEIRFWLPCPRAEVFDFFADVRNLDRLTPEWLRFEVLSDPTAALDVGSRIDYRLRWRSFPLRWQSEITEWRRPSLLTYEQRRGPYRRWLHEHRYEERDGGTEVIDRVEWSVWGAFAVGRWVASDVRQIFEHRVGAVHRLLDLPPDAGVAAPAPAPA